MNLMWENIFKKDQKDKEVTSLLANNVIFEDLNARELGFVETLVHIRNYRAGEHIFRQGEVGVGMYIVINGYVDVTVDNVGYEAQSKTVYVTKLEPGDFFGEISLIEVDGRRTANAIAHNDCSLLGFFKPDLTELIDRNPVTGIKVVIRLAQVLGRRLRETSVKITELKNELQKA